MGRGGGGRGTRPSIYRIATLPRYSKLGKDCGRVKVRGAYKLGHESSTYLQACRWDHTVRQTVSAT